jgi:AcrR family transcriptional regulator
LTSLASTWCSSRVSARTSTTKKRAYHHGDLARALVTAATRVIEERGPEAFTLREVASATGVTHAAAYRHFDDKSAMLAAVAEAGYRALLDRMAKAAAAGIEDPRDRLRAICAASIAYALEHPAQYRVMTGPRLNEDGRFPALETAIGDTLALVVAEIERGQATGAFRKGPPRDLALAVWIASHGFVDLVLRRRLKVKSTGVALEYADKLMTPLFDGMVRRKRGQA